MNFRALSMGDSKTDPPGLDSGLFGSLIDILPAIPYRFKLAAIERAGDGFCMAFDGLNFPINPTVSEDV